MKRVLVFIICAGFVIEKDIPNIESVITLSDGLLVQWSWKGNADSIDGFKIKVWIVESQEQGYFNLVNGDQIPGLTLNHNALEKFDQEKLPKSKPRIIVISDSEAREVKIDDIKYNKLHEIRILTYDGREDGPLSGPTRIRLIKPDEAINVIAAQRQNNDCVATVATNLTIYGETYFHLRNIYL
ncbi:unnamed protein product [Pieris macdunnoughi]|uniref:Uncharacterized protein n=1 Tax=Pieris macdunnoughi TaxID=345717 RepID=A0A821WPH1_9NEOP|nr:unnamed protein product [Pieris macdunnoughi]